MSSAYDSLDPRVRKWVYKQGWSTLRPLQESSIRKRRLSTVWSRIQDPVT